MKHLLLSCLLLAGLAGCGKKSDDAAPAVADPLLGHWQAETNRSVWYYKDGSVNHDNTYNDAAQLDVTPTTITFTSVSKGVTYKEAYPYTRSGEMLTMPTWPQAGARLSAKSLTASGWVFEEYVPHPNTGGWAIGTLPLHR